MQFIKVKTPLNVNVNVQHAGVGLRLLAFIIDMVIIFVYLRGVHYLFYDLLGLTNTIFESQEGEAFDVFSFMEIIYVILQFPAIFYSLLTETLFNGQSFGKMVCNIRVVKLNGYHAGFTEYFTRWIFRFIDFWTGFFLILFLIPIFGEEKAYIIGLMMMMMSGFVAFFLIIRTKNSQRLGDIVAGTTVLKLKDKESIDITILEELKESYSPRYPEAQRLSDNDARIIKDTYRMAVKRRDGETLRKLRDKLEEVMEIKAEQPASEFIDTVLKDFNYYTQEH